MFRKPFFKRTTLTVVLHGTLLFQLGYHSNAWGQFQSVDLEKIRAARTAISDIRSAPYSAIVRLITESGHCTATAISQKHLITAAHCVSRLTSQGWISSPVSEIQADENALYPRIPASRVYIPAAWLRGKEKADYALVTLASKLPDSVRPMELGTATGREIRGPIQLAGFPSCLSSFTLYDLNLRRQFFQGINPHKIYFQPRTCNGDSGAALRIRIPDATSGGNWKVVGIHSGNRFVGSAFNSIQITDEATRLTDSIVQELQNQISN